MKRLVLVFVILISVGSITNSCKKKYPENKFGSFKRTANRMGNGKVWELDKYLMNDVNQTLYDGQYYKQTYSELCVGGGDMKCNKGLLVVESLLFSPSLSYTWELSEDETTFTSILVGDPLTPSTPKRTIRKLTRNEFWYVYTDENGNKQEFHLKRKHTFGK